METPPWTPDHVRYLIHVCVLDLVDSYEDQLPGFALRLNIDLEAMEPFDRWDKARRWAINIEMHLELARSGLAEFWEPLPPLPPDPTKRFREDVRIRTSEEVQSWASSHTYTVGDLEAFLRRWMFEWWDGNSATPRLNFSLTDAGSALANWLWDVGISADLEARVRAAG